MKNSHAKPQAAQHIAALGYASASTIMMWSAAVSLPRSVPGRRQYIYWRNEMVTNE